MDCKEIDLKEDTFSECNLISSSYNILANNAMNKYGTASLVKNEFVVENINNDTEGRVIAFDIGNITFCNLYLPAGNDPIMRSSRENYAAETIPKILINKRENVCIGGDLNGIIDKKDATRNPETKVSAYFKRLVSTFSWIDSYRSLHPGRQTFSRYYSNDHHGEGATRIDRMYHEGNMEIMEAEYEPSC